MRNIWNGYQTKKVEKVIPSLFYREETATGFFMGCNVQKLAALECSEDEDFGPLMF